PFAAIGKDDHNAAGALHHMMVGQGVALRRDDHTASAYPLIGSAAKYGLLSRQDGDHGDYRWSDLFYGGSNRRLDIRVRNLNGSDFIHGGFRFHPDGCRA